jgi:predicted GH43/DUF377 family glycosyl hydrolase
MRWAKRGLIFVPPGNSEWMATHAALPVADDAGGGALRIYFGARDRQNRYRTGSLDVAADDPAQVVCVRESPVLDLGPLGAFDDNGVAPSWIVTHDNRKYLYYLGWNPRTTVPYHLAIGLAISEDGGDSFRRCSVGPICERGIDEPYFNTTPSVLLEDGAWRMWYTSCTGWQTIHGHAEPFYHVKHAESPDGCRWQKTGHVCIDYDDFTAAIARPCVYRHSGMFRMLYSYRSALDYRTDPAQSYRIGYAESSDGLHWTRKDDLAGISRSAEGWDSQMIEYCYVYRHGEKTYLFYNGNGFGQSGLGYAVLEHS